MICEPCRRDVHIHCPELARQALAEGVVPVTASELMDGQRCDCGHRPRREVAAALTERAVVFAGALDPGDWTFSDDSAFVTIDRKERDMLADLPELLQEWAAGLRPGPLMETKAAVKYGAAFRSLRPYTVVSAGWDARFAGMGMEDVLTLTADDAASRSGFMPGHVLEAWSLPVVTVQFDFLITPAGEWDLDG